MSEENPSIRERLETIMTDGEYKNRTRENLLDELENLGFLKKTKQIAHDFAEKARKNLEVLPETEYRLALEEIPNFVIERNK